MAASPRLFWLIQLYVYCRERLATSNPPVMTASAMVSWKRRSTPGPPTSVVGKFRMFYSPEITLKSRNGAKSRQSHVPGRIGRIYSAEDSGRYNATTFEVP